MEVLLTWRKILGLGKMVVGCFCCFLCIQWVFCLKVMHLGFNSIFAREERQKTYHEEHMLFNQELLYRYNIHILYSILYVCLFLDTSTYHELLSKSTYMCIFVFTYCTFSYIFKLCQYTKRFLAQSLAAHRQGYRVTSLHMGNGWVTP